MGSGVRSDNAYFTVWDIFHPFNVQQKVFTSYWHSWITHKNLKLLWSCSTLCTLHDALNTLYSFSSHFLFCFRFFFVVKQSFNLYPRISQNYHLKVSQKTSYERFRYPKSSSPRYVLNSKLARANYVITFCELCWQVYFCLSKSKFNQH